MKSRVLALVICLCILSSFFLTSCAGPTSNSNGKSLLTIAWKENLASLNPFLMKNEDDYAYLGYIYEPLCMPLKDGTVQPWIAKSWEFNSSENSWTFHIDPRAKWSDGQPLTATDVKYTFETTYKNDFFLGIKTKSLVSEIKAVDDKTVKFILKSPSPGFLAMAGATLIVPEHILSKVDKLDTFQNPNPVGSGPYLFKEYKQKSHIDLVKNDKYWQGAPKIDEILLRDFGGAENAILPFLKGDVDILPEMSGQETLIPQLLANKDVKVSIDKWPNIWYVAPNYRKYPLDVLDVRKAMDMALDKKELISVCLSGYADLPLMGYFPPVNTKWANTSVTWKGLDIQKEDRIKQANSLLDGLGFMKGSDGVRVTDKNTRMEFTLMCLAQYPSYVRASEMIQKYYAEIGIKINVETKDANTLFGDIVFSDKGGDKWDLLLHGSTPGTDPSDFAFEYAPDTNDAFFNGNAFGWKDEELQKLLRSTETEMDEAKRLEEVKQEQQMFADELVVLTIGHRNHIAAYRMDKYTGWNPTNVAYGSMIHPLLSIQNILSLEPVKK